VTYASFAAGLERELKDARQIASKYDDRYFATRELLNVSTERAEVLERELAAANARIRRLEKVGDEMERWMRNPRNLGGDPFMADQWQDAKETRP
jgi:flagellar motility protein MotE (MotC chaperone)